MREPVRREVPGKAPDPVWGPVPVPDPVPVPVPVPGMPSLLLGGSTLSVPGSGRTGALVSGIGGGGVMLWVAGAGDARTLVGWGSSDGTGNCRRGTCPGRLP
ncbi:hypothetical protein GCM10027199_40190 [Amycolatopsis magusensis]